MEIVRCERCDREFKPRGLKNHQRRCQQRPPLPQAPAAGNNDALQRMTGALERLEARLAEKDDKIAALQETTAALVLKVEELTRIIVSERGGAPPPLPPPPAVETPPLPPVIETPPPAVETPPPPPAVETPPPPPAVETPPPPPPPAVETPPPPPAVDDLNDRTIRYLEQWDRLEPLLERMEDMDDDELRAMMTGGHLDVADKDLCEMILRHGSVERFCRFMEEETTRLWDDLIPADAPRSRLH